MDTLTIPPSPNWYLPNVMACAPDNTLIYGCRHDLVVIKRTLPDKADDVHFIVKAHYLKIVSIDLNRDWGAPNKYAVTISEDKIVKLWDIGSLEKKSAHNKHAVDDESSKAVGACFAGNQRVISASEKGTIIIWNIINQETNMLTSLFNSSKTVLTCMSVCPHASWLVAFGLKSGLVVVADVRHSGKILYNLRGHSNMIVSLAWCPAPVNIFPTKPHNKVIEKKQAAPVVIDKGDTRKQKSPRKCSLPFTECCFYKDGLVRNNAVLVDLQVKIRTRRSKSIGDCVSMKQDVGSFTLVSSKTDVSQDLIAGETLPTSKELKVDTSSSSEDCKTASSTSSPETKPYCSKSTKERLNSEDPNKSSSLSDSNEIFHDCTDDIKEDKEVENWRTEQPVSVEEEPRKEFLLASSAREGYIYIWRAGTDGRMQTFITLPNLKKSKYQKKKSKSSEKSWIALCWVAPNILLSSSGHAELLQWNLPKPLLQTKFPIIVRKDHWNVLFCLKSPVSLRNEYNFLQKQEINVWTTGMDRTIVNVDLESEKHIALYSALGGSVNCLCGSPLDPCMIAIGSGEGVVSIWHATSTQRKVIPFSTFYQKILNAVSIVAWHPVNETSLAWGTVEGRIGLFEVRGKGKQPKLLHQFFKSQIFKLEWGPIESTIERQRLFVVSESKVAIFDALSTTEEPELLPLPDNTAVYTIAWKPDYSFLLVSSKSGSILMYSPDLKLLHTMYLSHKLQSILWHPDATTNDINVSKYCHMFVSTVKSSEFVVFDMNVQSDNFEDRIIVHFENRGVKINAVAWSPYSGNHLVLVDEGGVAQVYDIEAKIVISTFINQGIDPILSVLWSPLDADYIIIGTVSHKIIVWKVSEHLALTATDINAQRNKILKAQQKEMNDLVVKKEKESNLTGNQEEFSKTKPPNKSQILPHFYSFRDKAQAGDLLKLLEFKLGNKDVEGTIGDGKHIDVLDVFGDSGNLEKVFDVNLTAFRQQKFHHNGNILSLFQGDINTTITDAIAHKRVNPWIISLCPMVSPLLWQNACETYVEQLLEQPEADSLEIVAYMLACHKVEESIELLCERHLFREAFALARARFGGQNYLEADILERWAKSNVFQGNFELAACCYISVGKFDAAASVLFRRSSVELLEIAAKLAEVSGNDELHKAVVCRLSAFQEDEGKKQETGAKVQEEESQDVTENKGNLLQEENHKESSQSAPSEISIEDANKCDDKVQNQNQDMTVELHEGIPKLAEVSENEDPHKEVGYRLKEDKEKEQDASAEVKEESQDITANAPQEKIVKELPLSALEGAETKCDYGKVQDQNTKSSVELLERIPQLTEVSGKEDPHKAVAYRLKEAEEKKQEASPLVQDESQNITENLPQEKFLPESSQSASTDPISIQSSENDEPNVQIKIVIEDVQDEANT